MLALGNSGVETFSFQRMLFLDFFSINPMPSKTFVMSYIRLFWTFSTSAARLRSMVPWSARSMREMNFFVSKLRELRGVSKVSEFACCLDKILNKGEEPVVSAGCCSRCVHRGSRSTIFLVPQDVHEPRSDRETTTHKIIKRYEGIPRRYFAGQEIKLSVTKSYHYLQTKVKEIKLMVQSNYLLKIYKS